MVYESMARVDEAADAWQHVVQLTPDDAEAWEHLGAWREEQGLSDEAIDAYRKAADLTPESSGLRFSLAEALRDAEHYDEAIDAFRGLVQEHSDAEDEDDEEALADAYSGLAAIAQSRRTV